jgi:hypothetical protein
VTVNTAGESSAIAISGAIKGSQLLLSLLLGGAIVRSLLLSFAGAESLLLAGSEIAVLLLPVPVLSA